MANEFGNCGQCLMEAVEVVQLRADGSCPRCEGNYSLDKAPTPDAELVEYVLHFDACLKGAIGGQAPYVARRKAATVEGAWQQLYNEYEHVRRGRADVA